MTDTPDSARKLRGFINKEYLNNPKMGSPNWSAAIRDVLTDLLHLGEMFGVDVRERLDGAEEVYKEETE